MIRLRQVKLPIDDNNLLEKVARLLKVEKENIREIKIKKKSLDAREKLKLLFVYELDCLVENEEKVLKKSTQKIFFK